MAIKRDLFEFGPPLHPGEMLLEEFMKALGLTNQALGAATGIPPARISAITRERFGISAKTALLLAKYFSMTPNFWVNLQSHYELSLAAKSLGKRKPSMVRPRKQEN